MQKIFSKLNPEWALRLGIGFMYFYSAYDIFYNTEQWKSYIPSWMFHFLFNIGIPLALYLKLQAVGELALGLLFIAWFSGKWGLRIASILATIEMAGILLFVGIDRITFRDIGLLGAGIALVIMAFQRNGTPVCVRTRTGRDKNQKVPQSGTLNGSA